YLSTLRVPLWLSHLPLHRVDPARTCPRTGMAAQSSSDGALLPQLNVCRETRYFREGNKPRNRFLLDTQKLHSLGEFGRTELALVLTQDTFSIGTYDLVLGSGFLHLRANRRRKISRNYPATDSHVLNHVFLVPEWHFVQSFLDPRRA